MDFFELNGNFTSANFIFGVLRAMGVMKAIAVLCSSIRIQDFIWNVNGLELRFIV
jgi:hypothetical protein